MFNTSKNYSNISRIVILLWMFIFANTVNAQWHIVGSAGFSDGSINYPSIAFNGSTPYVVYSDLTQKSPIVKKFDGTNWVSVGNQGFAFNGVSYTSLAFNGSTPYVAYQDYGSDYAYKSSVKKFDGANWIAVGDTSFSAGEADNISLVINNSIPYVVYTDAFLNAKITVMKFNGSNWVAVGNPGFSDSSVMSPALAFNGSTPYVSFSDAANNNKITVMKFNGSNWVTVGNAGFSDSTTYATSIAINGSTPYVSYQDIANGGKATVKKFDGTNWINVGNPGFSAGNMRSNIITFYGSTPYVLFQDNFNGGKTTLMEFDGTNWVTVGNAGFTGTTLGFLSIAFNSNGFPFVAFSDGDNNRKITVSEFGCDNPVKITQQPVSTPFCAGGNAFYSIGVSGTGVSYDWQTTGLYAPNTWYDHPSGGSWDYASTFTDTVRLNDIYTTYNQVKFRCIVTGSCNADTSVLILPNILLPSYSVPDTITACGSYSWKGATYNNSGIYYDTVGASTIGCDSIATLVLTIKNLPPKPVIAASGPSNICNSGTVTLNAIDSIHGKTTRFVSNVIDFSSQYGNYPGGYSANDLTGAPNVYPVYGDNGNAWAPAGEDNQREYLVLGFNNPAPVNYVDVYETNNPGTIDTVYVKNPNTGNFEVVYTHTAAATAQVADILHITFPMTKYNVSEIRIAINAPVIPSTWVEIDAVAIGNTDSIYFPSFKWSNGIDTTSSITIHTIGKYTVTATLNGCSINSDTTTVIKNDSVKITLQPVSSVVCSGGSAFYSTGATGSGLTYNWQTTGINNNNYSSHPNGGAWDNASTYTDTVRLTNISSIYNQVNIRCIITGNCNTDTSVVITPKVSSPTYSTAESVTACGSYKWRGKIYNTTGLYQDTTGVNSIGCDSIALLDLTINSLPVKPVINAAGPTSFCSNSSVTLNAVDSAHGKSTRYVSNVIGFSSEYGITLGGYSANDLIGAPNVYPAYGDNGNAWAPAGADNQREYLVLGFNHPAPINYVDVYETFNPGTIDTVYVKNPNTGNFDVIYTHTAAATAHVADILHITFPKTSYDVSEIRIAINAPEIPSNWVEIDAVAIGNTDSAYVNNTDTIHASINHFVSNVLAFSSQWGTNIGANSASDLIGVPNVYPAYGDSVYAWSPASEDTQREFLELGFNNQEPINFIDVYETFNPGSIDTVYVKNPNTGQFEVVYTHTPAEATAVSDILHITFPMTTYNVSEIRIAINAPVIPKNWVEIDAVSIGKTDSIYTTTYNWSPGGLSGQTLTATNTGKYTVAITSYGCTSSSDTIVVTRKPSSTSVTSVTACGNYLWNGKIYTASGTYTDTTTNWLGCDSIATLKLIISAAPVYSITDTVSCSSIVIKGISYSSSTVVKDTLKNSNGCDSVYLTVNITIKNSFSGNIISPNKILIPKDSVSLNGTNNENGLFNGNYSFGCLSAGDYEMVQVSKNNDITKANGVTALDLALIQSHILQKTLLNNPYKIIAADVSGDGKITTLDLVYIKRLILGIDTTFTNTTTNQKRLWAFVDSSYKFADTTNPFPFRDSISYTTLNANKINQTFIGCKLGDVNWDWNPAVARPFNNTANAIVLSYDAINTSNQSTVIIPVKVKNFKDMSGMQFTISFDAGKLQWQGLGNNPLGIETGTNHANEGSVTFLWVDPKNEIKTLEDGSVIMELVFKTINSLNNETLDLNSSVTEIAAYDKDYNLHGIVMNSSLLNSGDIVAETWTVSPNPITGGVINVRMNLKANKSIVLRLSDNSGRVILVKEVEGVKGSNSFTFSSQNKLSTGTFYLQAIGVECEKVKKIMTGN